MRKIKINGVAILSQNGIVFDVVDGDNIVIYYDKNKVTYSSNDKKITQEHSERFTTEKKSPS